MRHRQGMHSACKAGRRVNEEKFFYSWLHRLGAVLRLLFSKACDHVYLLQRFKIHGRLDRGGQRAVVRVGHDLNDVSDSQPRGVNVPKVTRHDAVTDLKRGVLGQINDA